MDGESEPVSIDQLRPGNILVFNNIEELVSFEDIVARRVDSDFDEELWSRRVNIRELLRPSKPNVFNGRLVGIELEVMENPYGHLITIGERGFSIPYASGKNFRLSNAAANELMSRYQGFTFTAGALSTRGGLLGHIQAELYYYPAQVIATVRKDETVRVVKRAGAPEAIRRAVTRPKLIGEKLTTSDKRARQLGAKIMAYRLKNPFSTGMQ